MVNKANQTLLRCRIWHVKIDNWQVRTNDFLSTLVAHKDLWQYENKAYDLKFFSSWNCTVCQFLIMFLYFLPLSPKICLPAETVEIVDSSAWEVRRLISIPVSPSPLPLSSSASKCWFGNVVPGWYASSLKKGKCCNTFNYCGGCLFAKNQLSTLLTASLLPKGLIFQWNRV